jgi:hypothetical protein
MWDGDESELRRTPRCSMTNSVKGSNRGTGTMFILSRSLGVGEALQRTLRTVNVRGIPILIGVVLLSAMTLLWGPALRTQLFRTPNNADLIVPARLAARGERIPLMVKCRERPLKVLPTSGLANVVSEEDLVTVLCSALPLWHPPSVPSAFHELKLWGRSAVFTKEMLGKERTGDFLVTTLLSDKLCRENTVKIGASYLVDSPFGIHPVLAGSDDAIEYRAEAHHGQLLMVLGEVGVPATTPVTTSSGRVGNVADRGMIECCG